MTNFIGRQRNVGIGKETVRGTAVTAEYWIPAIEFSNDDKIVQAVNESAHGKIGDADDARIVKTSSEAELTAKLDNEAFGLILLGVLGESGGPALVSGETIVYDHVGSVGQNAQHPTFTLSIQEPNGELKYALTAIDSLEVTAELEKFVQYTVSMMGNSAIASAVGTPDYIENPNVFLPQHCSVTLYPTVQDMYDDTNGIVYPFKKLGFTVSKNVEDDQVLGNVSVADRFNKQFVIEGTLELLYSNRDLIDDYLLADTAFAMKVNMIDTSVTLGVASNPEVEFSFYKVKLSEIAREQGNNDIVSQSLSFKAFYNPADDANEQLSTRVRNLRSTAY